MSSYFGYDVILCMNITDVDDKIILRAREEGIAFDALSRREEKSFLADMRALGVAPPDVMTRVSEYVPEVVRFIEGIIANGYAYESNGSVYFDTEVYRRAPNHTYGKLVPENVGNVGAAEEGEGALSAGAGDKRNACDFALWKASKPGEPTWPSPWGEGRPGWHIECSAMCGDTLGAFAGGRIDIHSGGIDLRFPHHENEIAQSEACLNCSQWVNYFIHSGHLNIEGLKMSKSLKNFVKIADALEHYSARRLRLFFLLQRYNAPMNYSESAMDGVAAVEKTYSEFFANVRARLRAAAAAAALGGAADPSHHWGSREKEFARAMDGTKAEVREALCDDFNTPGAMAALGKLVGECNRYMAGADARPLVPLLLKAAGDFVTHIFRCFGLADALPEVGWGSGGEGGGGGGGGGDGAGGGEAALAPILDILAAFRERVKEAAKRGDGPSALLALCDDLRDSALPPKGIKLEDAPQARGGGGGGGGGGASAPPPAAAPMVRGEVPPAQFWSPTSTTWKLQSPEEFRREAEAAAEGARKKADAKAALAKAAEEREAKARVPPGEMFRGGGEEAAKYSAWDAEGLPTHDAAGVALGEKVVAKLRKAWEEQRRVYAKWQEKAAAAVAAGGGGGGGAGDKK
jgi:cysteinyl-tRNA synthetase